MICLASEMYDICPDMDFLSVARSGLCLHCELFSNYRILLSGGYFIFQERALHKIFLKMKRDTN